MSLDVLLLLLLFAIFSYFMYETFKYEEEIAKQKQEEANKDKFPPLGPMI